MADYDPGYCVYSIHGKLLDRLPTLEDAKRCLWVWYSAAYITHNGEVVFKKEHSSQMSPQ